MKKSIECDIHIIPAEWEKPENGFTRYPRIEVKCSHPVFDHEIEQDVIRAFKTSTSQHELTKFLTEYDYPFHKPKVATVEWSQNMNPREDVKFTKTFEGIFN